MRAWWVAPLVGVLLAGGGAAAPADAGPTFFCLHLHVWTVCQSSCNYATIQDAVNGAGCRDSIEIEAGTYGGFVDPSTTQLSFLGSALTGECGAESGQWEYLSGESGRREGPARDDAVGRLLDRRV